MSLFEGYEPAVPVTVKLSADQKRTIRARTLLAVGKHPANSEPVDLAHKCGDCLNLNRYDYHSRRYLKCAFHRLGETHSAASDMRASWPACTHWQPE